MDHVTGNTHQTASARRILNNLAASLGWIDRDFKLRQSCHATVVAAIQSRKRSTDRVILLGTDSVVAHSLLVDAAGAIVADSFGRQRQTTELSTAVCYEVNGMDWPLAVIADISIATMRRCAMFASFDVLPSRVSQASLTR